MPGEGGAAAYGAQGGLELLAGLFGYLGGEQAAGMAQSRASLLRMESEADARRYMEQADHLVATQKVEFLKAGVQLTGSPLDILDETMRVSTENINAIRARGAQQAQDLETQGAQASVAGRMALLSGITGGALSVAKGAKSYQDVNRMQSMNRKSTPTGFGGGYPGKGQEPPY